MSWVSTTMVSSIINRWFTENKGTVMGIVLYGINGVAAVHMKDVGLDTGYITTVLSAHSLALTVFKFFTGFFYDKFGLRATMSLCSVASIVSMVAVLVAMNFVINSVNRLKRAIAEKEEILQEVNV